MKSASEIYRNKQELQWEELFPKDFCALSFLASGRNKNWEGMLNLKQYISKYQLSISEMGKKNDSWKNPLIPRGRTHTWE